MCESIRRSSATRPNFFIAIPIDDEEIVSNVKKVQKEMILIDGLIPPQKLHLTISVLRLEGETVIQKARSILKETCKWITRVFGHRIAISFKGVGSFEEFFPSVVAQVADESAVKFLTAVHEHLKEKFIQELGITMDSSMEFHPHLRIAKIPCSRELANKASSALRYHFFDPCLMWHENTRFGIQSVKKIQLLRMGSEDPTTEQYISSGDFALQNAPSQENSPAFLAMLCVFAFLAGYLVRCCI